MENNAHNTSTPNKEKNNFLPGAAVLCLSYVLLCLYAPFSTRLAGEWSTLALAIAACALSVFALTRIAGSFKAVSGFVFVVAIFMFLGGSVLPVALFVSFAAASCIWAYLLLKVKHPALWALPALPLIICALSVRSVGAAMLSVSSVICSLCLAYVIRSRRDRVSAVCNISAGLCVSVAVALVYAVYVLRGEISGTVIRELLDSAKQSMILTIDGMLSQMGMLAEVGLDVTNIASVAVSSVFNLLPAIVIVICNVCAYVLHSLFMSVLFTTPEQRQQSVDMLEFNMSIHSAIIYIVAIILSLILSSDKTAMYGAVAQNLAVVLAPGLILIALAGMRALMAKKASCLGTLLYVGVIFLLASLSVIVITVVALIGAILIIAANIAQAKKEK